MKRILSLVIFSNHFALQVLFSGYKALKNLIFLSAPTFYERAVSQGCCEAQNIILRFNGETDAELKTLLFEGEACFKVGEKLFLNGYLV